MFQFQCPNGHLLQGDESQAGQQCTCPMCNTLFIIPQPIGGAGGSEGRGGGGENASFPSFIGPPGGNRGGVSMGPGPTAHEVDPMAPVTEEGGGGFSLGGTSQASQGPALYHIPCPNGHELEVPEEMLRQDVLCPFCEVQFHLRLKDSVEYKKQQAEEQERKDRKAGKLWLNWAIAIATIVFLTLFGLIAYDIWGR